MKPSADVVVFEELRPIHCLLVMWAIEVRRSEVWYIRLEESCLAFPWFRSYRATGRLKELALHYTLNTFDGMYYDKAFDNVERFSTRLLDHRLLESVRRLYGPVAGPLVFKKAMLERLARFYYLNYTMSALRTAFCGKRIAFVPSRGIPPYRTDGCEVRDYARYAREAEPSGAQVYPDDGVSFHAASTISSFACACVRSIKAAAKGIALALYMPSMAAMSLFVRMPFLKDRYRQAIMIVSPARQFANDIQGVDFLLDGKTVKKEETVFLSYYPLSPENRRRMSEKGLEYHDSLDRFMRAADIIMALPLLCSSVLAARDAVLSEAAAGLVLYYVRWRGVSTRCKIDTLITYCDFSAQATARNILLARDGCETFYYMDSSNYGTFLGGDDPAKYRHSNFSYLYYDHFIAWGKRAIEYYRSSYCDIREYHDVGCLWSEHLRLICEGVIRTKFGRTLADNGWKPEMKILSVFDSSFHDDSLTTCADGLLFLTGIYEFIERSPDVYLVIKEKNTKSFCRNAASAGRSLKEMYEKLERHPRCLLAGKKVNASEVIASSDLVVGFPFTSTTFEALACRKRSLWFDASGKFRRSFYDAVPGLVCHNTDELFARAKELLFATADSDYDAYLDRFVKGRVESYLDGKALTRFRAIIDSAGRKRGGS